MSYELRKSSKAGKKWTVTTPSGEKIHFGAAGMSDFTKHKDEDRRERYFKRHGGQSPSYKVSSREKWECSGLDTPGFWSRWLTWNEPSIDASIQSIENKCNINIQKESGNQRSPRSPRRRLRSLSPRRPVNNYSRISNRSKSPKNPKCPWTVKELREICKYEHISCSGTKEQLCERLMKHIDKLAENEDFAKDGGYTPEKYFKGLSPKEREKRLREIRKRSKADPDDPNSYKPFTTDYDPKTGKIRKTKTSNYTKAFYDMYPKAKTLKQKSQITGIPEDILKKVYRKGLAAWKTGHRPGATQGQWGSARVHSFIMKGCTYYYPDHKLVEEAKRRSSKAEKHWDSVTCICKKGCNKRKNQPKKKKI